MERNAFLLVKLIQQVNDSLNANLSTEKLVVIGPSMGGQISRYALAYMEKQQSLGVPKMNHNTRLFLSFDSPNDGANIPLALAHNLDFFGNFAGQTDAKDSYDQQLHSIAARQLLIEQLDGLNSTASFHQTFFNNIRNGGLPNSGGYPINLRKVTLLNGNGQSIKTYSDGVEVLSLHGVKSRVLGFIAEDNFLPSYNQFARIAKTRLIIPSVSLGGCYTFGIFTNYPCNIAFFNSSYYLKNLNSHGCMDAIQGSTFNATNAVYKGFDSALIKKGINERNLFTLNPNHCFIPSVSALAFRNPNFNWNDNVTNRNLLCNNEIWYDGYFIPPTNEEHITLTAANVDWITQEIDKGQPNCPKICTYQIIGSNNLCLNFTQTYSLDVPIPAGCSIQWSADPGIAIDSYTNTSVNIRATSNGDANVYAKIINPCGANTTITKKLILGTPVPSEVSFIRYAGPNLLAIYPPSFNYLCPQETGKVISVWPTADYVWWTKLNPAQNQVNWWQYGYIQHSSEMQLYFWNGLPGAIADFKLEASNVCGATTYYPSFQSVNCNGTAPCNNFVISPNPTKGQITIANRPAPLPNLCNGGATKLDPSGKLIFNIEKVVIYDGTGTMLKTEQVSKLPTYSTTISTLTKGIYTVEIWSGTAVEKQSIVVQ